jgi:hypothetical protein
MPRPIQFVKEHPVGFVASAATGMIAGPWFLSMVSRFTGLSIGVPSFHGGARLSSDDE